MIHHSVLVDVSREILNDKDRIMNKRITVASINPYALNLLIYKPSNLQVNKWTTSTCMGK